jgi:predicted RND superfamily exporter protein
VHKALLAFSIFLARLLGAALRRPRTTVTIFSLMFVIAIFGLSRLQIRPTIESILDSGLQASLETNKLRQEFPTRSSFLVLLSRSDRPFSEEDDPMLRALAKRLEADWSGEAEIIGALSARQGVWDEKLERLIFPDAASDRRVSSARLSKLMTAPFARMLELRPQRNFEASTENLRTRRSVESFLSEHQLNWAFSLGGSGAFDASTQEGIARNSQLNALLYAAIFVILFLLFGTLKAPAVFMGTLGVTNVLVLGFMGLVGAPIDVISSGLILMIAVATLQDFMFVGVEISEKGRFGAWTQRFRKLLVPCFFTSLTTIVGFWSLGFSEFDSIRRFGFWAGLACAIEWCVLFLLYPAAIKLYPKLFAVGSTRSWIVRHAQNPWVFHKLARPLSLGLLAFYVWGVLGSSQLNVSGSPKEMFTSSHPFAQSVQVLRNHFEWEDRAELWVPSHRSDSEKATLLETLRADLNVREVVSPQVLLDEATALLPQNDELRTLAARLIEGRPFWRDWRSSSGNERWEIYVKETHHKEMMGLVSRLRTLCMSYDCKAAGSSVVQADFAEHVPHDLLKSMSSTLGLVFVLVLLLVVHRLRSHPDGQGLRMGVALMLGSFWAPFVIVSGFAFFGLRVNFLACLFLGVLIGMTGDNCIQFIYSNKRFNFEDSLRQRGQAAFMLSLVLALCCMIYIGSSFESPRTYGLALGVGILLSYIGDNWIARSLSARKS